MHIILLGTLDTKQSEVLYLQSQLLQTADLLSLSLEVTLIDVGCRPVTSPEITISHKDLLQKYIPEGSGSKDPWSLPRGEAIKYISACATQCVSTLLKEGPVHGIIGTGGSGGTSLISTVMRDAAPIGLPKMIVSTIASGNTGSVVGECDITLMYSVVDIAGQNQLLRDVLSNAAGSIVGMASAYQYRIEHRPGQGQQGKKTRVGITMFGVTTPSVDAIRKHLETNYNVEVYVFHATGHGGKAMERLVSEGYLDAIIDLTTTEICDLVAGGEMACDGTRLETGLKRGIPNIISVGATDMVNFGPEGSIPSKYREKKGEGERKFFVHNPSVTLMRTNKEECRAIGEFIVEKIQKHARQDGKVEVWIPKGAVSAISGKGGVFEDREADEALFDALRQLKGTVKVVEDEHEVNDGGFAVDIADRLMTMAVK
ncbi:hypothetical protein BDV18DRAFT_146905 [Aspergillus unguis]